MNIEKSKLQLASISFVIGFLLAASLFLGFSLLGVNIASNPWTTVSTLVCLSVLAFFVYHLYKNKKRDIPQSEARAISIINNTVDGIVVSDTQGTIIDINVAAESMFGYEAKEVINLNVSMLMPGSESGHHHQYINAHVSGGIQKVMGKGRELEGLHKDGTTFPLRISLAEIKWGTERGFTTLIRDVTEEKKIETALSESEARYRFFIDNVDEGIMITEQGLVTDASNTWLKMFGYSMEDVIGRSSLDFIAILDRDRASDMITNKSSETYDLHLLRANGTEFPARVKGHNLVFGGRNVRLTTSLDITTQIKHDAILSESEERYRFFIDNVDEAIIVTEEGLTIDVSSVWLTKFGCKLEDIIGRSPLEYTAESTRSLARSVISSGSYEAYESRMLRSDGTEFPALVRGRNLVFGGRKIRMTTILDITKQKEDEAALIAAKQQADKANQAKSDFLSKMSHELRTPLNAILGFGQLLKIDSQTVSNGKYVEQIDHILDGGEHLLKLINEILELSHIESGKMVLNIENVSIADLLNECQSLMSVIARESGIGILIESDAIDRLKARVDYARFKQVLINLISNAIKYNSQGGKVLVSVNEVAGTMLRLNIADQGYGIPSDKIDLLFKPFSRLGAAEKGIEGTGIGLVVCKDLIELMGGTIGVESEEGTGSIFWIEVPLGDSSGDSPIGIEETTNLSTVVFPGMKGTLLYVEDNPINILLMEAIVSKMGGLAIVTALTGEEGIELAKTTKPDIIILDINLPDMSGIEVLEELHRYNGTKAIPALALSAAATEDDIVEGLEAGFMQYLTKPISIPEVVEAISAAMKSS